MEELHRYLLPKTLEHAVRNSPFYAEWLGSTWNRVEGPEDLPLLPVLEKSTCVDQQDRMRCGPPPNDFGSVSSGTTRVGNRFFRVERNEDETRALAEYFDMVGGPRNRGPSPLVLHILTPNHGLPAAPAPPNTLRIAWAYSHNVFQLVEQALQADLQGRRITVLRVSVSVLKQLTAWFLSSGVDMRAFSVREIGTYAAQVTPRWRANLEKLWGARIYDNYSLSEFKTAATQCRTCGFYHFTEPPLIAEYLDPRTQKPTTDDVAHLVLTGLYPYVQRTPLIRYATNDLVERGPQCARAGARGFRFLGRRNQTLMDDQHHLMFPLHLEAIADADCDVARHTHPSERTEKLPPNSVGDPKYRCALVDGQVVVTVGTMFHPQLFPAAAAALQKRLARKLRKAHPGLVKSGRTLRVELVHGQNDDDYADWFVKYLM